MFVLGTDIGYSNLKVAYGLVDLNSPLTSIRPATAVPAERYCNDPLRIGRANSDVNDVTEVLVGDRWWVVGAPPKRLDGHASYIRATAKRTLTLQ